jgi:hypothetical protein
MVTTQATRTNASTCVIHDMNARALLYMEHGMNQEAVQLLDEAVRYLGTYYLRHKRYWYHIGMMSNVYDCSAQQLHATRNLDICVDVDPNANDVWTTPTDASSPYSGISVGDCSIIHENAVSLPQLPQSDATYTCAFRLPFSDERIASVEFRTQSTAVILYNMALAIHRYGIQSGRSEALRQAAISYNTVLALVGPHALILYPESVVIILGIMCNLAHIHLELRQIPEFLSARATLRDIMSKISLSQMSKDDFAFFNLHIFCLDRQDVCYAPAA